MSEMDRWIITADGSLPYRGVACDKAHVTLGAVYLAKEDAQRDMVLLSRYSKLKLRIVRNR